MASLFPEIGPWALACLDPDGQRVPKAPLSTEIQVLRAQRLIPIVASLLDQWPGVADRDLDAVVHIDAAFTAARTKLIGRHAVEVVGALGRLGIAVATIKGPGLAACYAMPQLRSYADIDLIVETRDFARVLHLLAEQGWDENPASLQPWPYFHRWCRESVNFSLGEERQVDIHHRPSPWIWTAGLSARAILAAAGNVATTEGPLVCAARSDNFLISALQLITDHHNPGSKLLAWRDVAELGRQAPKAIATRANEVGLGGLVKGLLRGMPETVRPLELESRLDNNVQHASRLVWMLGAASRGAQTSTHALRLPLANAAMYVAGTLVPGPAFLQNRYPAKSFRLSAWWHELLTHAAAE